MDILEKSHSSRAESLARQQILAFLKRAVGAKLKLPEISITNPPQPTFGDFSVSCFELAKVMQQSPVEAARVIAAMPLPKSTTNIFSSVRAAGPYVNFFVEPSAYGRSVLAQIKKEGDGFGAVSRARKPTVMVEYFSPNTNKPLTIGHLRNVFLGWSLSQILRTLGCSVIENSIYNDRGIALCKSIVAYRRWGNGATPESEHKKSDHFAGQFYVRFGQELAAHPELEEEAKAYLRQWEAGDKSVRADWRRLVDWAFSGFTQTLKSVDLDHPEVKYFESDIYQHGREVVQDGLARGVFKKHAEGYVYAPLEPFGMPDKILLRSDGTTLYVTQDIYLAKLKAEHKPKLSIYVVASEQDLAFRQLFKILEMLGEKYQTHHLSYGMIRLPEGKIKSREGLPAGTGADELVTELDSLAQMEVKNRHPELDDATVAERAHAIALGALKYYILQVNAKTTMVFDPKKSLAFTGKTGPYLQYVHARCASMLGKAGKIPTKLPADLVFADPRERALVVLMSRFPGELQRSAAAYDPSVLAHYLYELAQAFSAFYQDLPVLQAEGATRASRIQLVVAVKAVMARGLHLLGIPTPEQM